MANPTDQTPSAEDVLGSLLTFIEGAVAANGGDTEAQKPGHRVPFHWPPHPVSYRFHVLSSDWDGKTTWNAHGETFPVTVAHTPHGVFGRCEVLWHEARGDTLESMLENLAESAQPLFQRQFAINRTLGLEGRFTGHVRDLAPDELVRLLYCPDRDVANEARIEIETHASLNVFTPALIAILNDRRHPYRRSAQWCVLDLFEDLPSYCDTPARERDATQAMRDLVWHAENDFARTVYKAGVVLGGHLPDENGAPILLDCLSSPSKFGRRSAIHGLFHVVEWHPEQRDRVVAALRAAAADDDEPFLKEFASHMADDIEARRVDHAQEPLFEDEA